MTDQPTTRWQPVEGIPGLRRLEVDDSPVKACDAVEVYDDELADHPVLTGHLVALGQKLLDQHLDATPQLALHGGHAITTDRVIALKNAVHGVASTFLAANACGWRDTCARHSPHTHGVENMAGPLADTLAATLSLAAHLDVDLQHIIEDAVSATDLEAATS